MSIKLNLQIPSILMTFVTVLDLPTKWHFPHTIWWTLWILIIVEEKSIRVQHIRQGSLFSDHHMVHFNLITKLPLSTKAKLTYRKLKNNNITTFGYDITNALANQDQKGMSLEENIALYNNLLQRTLDTHAPMTTKEVIIRNKIPWVLDNIREQIQLWCKVERKWSHVKSIGDKYILFYRQKG